MFQKRQVTSMSKTRTTKGPVFPVALKEFSKLLREAATKGNVFNPLIFVSSFEMQDRKFVTVATSTCSETVCKNQVGFEME